MQLRSEVFLLIVPAVFTTQCTVFLLHNMSSRRSMLATAQPSMTAPHMLTIVNPGPQLLPVAAGCQTQIDTSQSAPCAKSCTGLQSAKAGGHARPDTGRYVWIKQRPGQV